MNNLLARSVSDWRWFFHAAKAEMGISSSWEPLAYIAQCGGPSRSLKADNNRGEERRLAASRKHARIEAALCLVPSADLGIIRLACEEPTHTLRLAYGSLGNLAHLSETAFKAHRRSQSKKSVEAWLDRLSVRCARPDAANALQTLSAEIARSCEDVLSPARDAYVRALGRI